MVSVFHFRDGVWLTIVWILLAMLIAFSLYRELFL